MENIQNNIRWGQSWNLAVEMISELEKESVLATKSEEKIKAWQKWFYEELGKRPPEVCEVCGGTAGIDAKGIVDPLIQGMHAKCRTDEKFKMRDYLK